VQPDAVRQAAFRPTGGSALQPRRARDAGRRSRLSPRAARRNRSRSRRISIYFITTKGSTPFAFAALWEWWRAKTTPKDEPDLEEWGFTLYDARERELMFLAFTDESDARKGAKAMEDILARALAIVPAKEETGWIEPPVVQG
jgi:putative SOS response-associated peptidase YedK